jgi:hypothetical protein
LMGNMQVYKYYRRNPGSLAWLLAATLLAPLTLGLACSAASSAAPQDQPELDIISNAMAYIREHHPDAAPYIPDNIDFKQSDTGDKRKIGYSRALYSGSGWTVSVGHAVTAVIIYEISADYSNNKIIWNGTSKNGDISEDSYKKVD